MNNKENNPTLPVKLTDEELEQAAGGGGGVLRTYACAKSEACFFSNTTGSQICKRAKSSFCNSCDCRNSCDNNGFHSGAIYQIG